MAYDNTLGRLPDPYTTPQGPGFTAQSLTDNSPGVVHRLNTGGSIGVKFKGNFWTINISLPELTPTEANNIYPFLYSVSGGFDNFYVQLPTNRNPKTGVWYVNEPSLIALGEISQSGTNSISIDFWPDRGGDLSVGDMIKFTNSHKIYLITKTSLVANVKTLYFNCDILEPEKIASAGLEPNDIKFRVKMEGSISPQITMRGVYDPLSLVLTENIL